MAHAGPTELRFQDGGTVGQRFSTEAREAAVQLGFQIYRTWLLWNIY